MKNLNQFAGLKKKKKSTWKDALGTRQPPNILMEKKGESQLVATTEVYII